jgi:hypothetical protein
MDSSRVENLKPRWRRLRLVERFANVLYPIDLFELLRQLPSAGYIVPQKTLKGIVEPGEAAALKGNIELVANQDNKTLGIEGHEISPAEIIDSFNKLRSFWHEHLDSSQNTETHYLELTGEGLVKTGKNPVKVFGQYWAQFSKMQELNKILGFEASNFGLQLTPTNTDPNSANWFDVRIHPLIVSSTNCYYVNLVWRNEDIDKAIKTFSKMDDTIANLILEVERE